tara:strand:- start:269 stop:526 length:258 start_codon:yes stop_codon:yes gene_type:complete
MKKNVSQADESGEDTVVFHWDFRKHEAIMGTARNVCETSADAVMCFLVAVVFLLHDREVAHHLLDSAYDAIESQDRALAEAKELH